MTYEPLAPVDPRDAFAIAVSDDAETTRSAAASQAAFLLSVRAGVMGRSDEIAAVQAEARATDFEIPPLEPLERDHRLTVAAAHRPLDVSAAELAQETTLDLRTEMSRMVDALYQQPSTELAAGLFEAAMLSPHPLVRVAGAAGARETTRSREQILEILIKESYSSDDLVARLAQEVLAQIRAAHPVLEELAVDPPTSRPRDRDSHTAVITHGTRAANATWYRPGGDFYTKLSSERPDLAVHDQSFMWTGLYSHTARNAAAVLLSEWIPDQGLNTPDFIAHSHGGTVANLATKKGVKFDRLVLLAWPVHSAWLPKFTNVNRIVDIRVHWDLVLLVDGGGQRFKPAGDKVKEHQNGWFDHSSVREPDYWDDHGLWAVI